MKNNSIVFKCSSLRCKQIFALHDHALLGISPFNSYYSEENIKGLLGWARSNFSSFHIFIPDTLPIHTFVALGYDESKAEKKTKKQVSYLMNKTHRALSHIGFSGEESQRKIITVSSMELNAQYIKLKQFCYDLYNSNIAFQNECIKCIHFILNSQNMASCKPEQYKIAIRYLLDEMPFFIDTPSILGVSISMFIYHQIPGFIDYLHNHMSKKITSISQGFMKVVVKKVNMSSFTKECIS